MKMDCFRLCARRFGGLYPAQLTPRAKRGRRFTPRNDGYASLRVSLHVIAVRATRSNPFPATARRLDCFVACAPRNDVEICLRILAARLRASYAESVAPSIQRAQGMPGAQPAPIA